MENLNTENEGAAGTPSLTGHKKFPKVNGFADVMRNIKSTCKEDAPVFADFGTSFTCTAEDMIEVIEKWKEFQAFVAAKKGE